MNLSEAEKSLEYFADLLDTHSALLRSAVGLEAQAGSVGMVPQAIAEREQAFILLQESCKEALILCIILYKEMGRQAERLVCVPIKTAKVYTALERVRQAEAKARLLLDEQKRIAGQKSEPKQESGTSKAIREFLEREENSSCRPPKGNA